MSRESKTGGVPGGVSTALAMGVPNVPIIVWRCVEEVERRGLDIIGEICFYHLQSSIPILLSLDSLSMKTWGLRSIQALWISYEKKDT